MAKTFHFIIRALLIVVAGAACVTMADAQEPTVISAQEEADTLDALKPPKRTRPVVVVLGLNEGADYVIVPAMHVPNDPAVLAWINQQAAQRATIVGVCAGAIVLANAGSSPRMQRIS